MHTSNKDFSKWTQKDFSLAFKLQVVDEIEKGYLTYKEAQKKYGIQGRSTVLVWLRKHGNLDLQSKIPMKKKAPPKPYIKHHKPFTTLIEVYNTVVKNTQTLSTTNHCLIRMTENGDPYENALAERMNRIIKEEFGL